MAAFLKVTTVGQRAKFQERLKRRFVVYNDIHTASVVRPGRFFSLDRTPSELAARHSELGDRGGWQPITVSQDPVRHDRAF